MEEAACWRIRAMPRPRNAPDIDCEQDDCRKLAKDEGVHRAQIACFVQPERKACRGDQWQNERAQQVGRGLHPQPAQRCCERHHGAAGDDGQRHPAHGGGRHGLIVKGARNRLCKKPDDRARRQCKHETDQRCVQGDAAHCAPCIMRLCRRHFAHRRHGDTKRSCRFGNAEYRDRKKIDAKCLGTQKAAEHHALHKLHRGGGALGNKSACNIEQLGGQQLGRKEFRATKGSHGWLALDAIAARVMTCRPLICARPMLCQTQPVPRAFP